MRLRRWRIWWGEQLEALPGCKAVPDLVMDPAMDEERLKDNTKRRRDEVAR